MKTRTAIEEVIEGLTILKNHVSADYTLTTYDDMIIVDGVFGITSEDAAQLEALNWTNDDDPTANRWYWD